MLRKSNLGRVKQDSYPPDTLTVRGSYGFSKYLLEFVSELNYTVSVQFIVTLTSDKKSFVELYQWGSYPQAYRMLPLHRRNFAMETSRAATILNTDRNL